MLNLKDFDDEINIWIETQESIFKGEFSIKISELTWRRQKQKIQIDNADAYIIINS